jgi:hypothetical protein
MKLKQIKGVPIRFHTEPDVLVRLAIGEMTLEQFVPTLRDGSPDTLGPATESPSFAGDCGRVCSRRRLVEGQRCFPDPEGAPDPLSPGREGRVGKLGGAEGEG